MDRRSLLAVALSVMVLITWQMLFAPKPIPRPAAPVSGALGTPGASGSSAPPAALESAAAAAVAETPAPPAPPVEAAAAATHEEFIVETQACSIRFSNEGGRILSWRLLRYLDEVKAPIEIIDRDAASLPEFPLRIVITGDDAATQQIDRALFTHEVRALEGSEDWPGKGFAGKEVIFEWADGKGLAVRKRLAIPATGYVNQVDVTVTKDGAPANAELTWALGLPESPEDKASRFFHTQGQGVIQMGQQTHRYPPKLQTQPMSFDGAAGAGALMWGGLESTYFASLVVPANPEAASFRLDPVKPPATAAAPAPEPLLAAKIVVKGAAKFMTIVGPKDYDLLSGLDRELDHAIDFSRFSLIYTLTKGLFLSLRWLNGYIGNYGVSIVLLTIVIRAAFFPITYRSAITMRQNAKKMGKIQPRVKSIQERYRKMKKSMETQREMNDEIMAVYKKEGLNPMGSLGGCLPLLLQMPVFIAFYNLLAVTIELRGAPFLFWVRDLSKMDPYYVSPILMGISWMAQQYMTSNTIPDPMQRRMMAVMPILFTFMMARMPSGLVIYWLVSNVIGLVQQYLINKKADAMAEAPA